MTTRYSIIFLAFILLAGSTQAQWIQWGQSIDGDTTGDGAGASVSMPDANTIAVGGKYESAGHDDEHVRVFTHNGSAWVQKGSNIESPPTMTRFGRAISMGDENTVAISLLYTTPFVYDAGHVLVYTWTGTGWMQKGMALDGEQPSDNFGRSVSMPDANTVAIGATSGGSLKGRVQVYAWDGTAWMQKGQNLDGVVTANANGRSVSMPDANTVAIGAQIGAESVAPPGEVRVFDWNGSLWVQRGTDILGQVDENFGLSISMPDANTVAVGAPGYHPIVLPSESDPFPNDGLARVYAWNGTEWAQKGADINDDLADDNTGWAVSMPDANTVAVSTPKDAPGGAKQGFVRVYGWNGTSWAQTGANISIGNNVSNRSGKAISMPDAQTIAVGAPDSNTLNGTNSGRVGVYTYGPTSIAAAHGQDHPFRIHTDVAPGQYVVDLGGMQQEVRVTLHDALGRTISGKQFRHTERFDLMLPTDAGLYFVNIRTANGPSATLKVVNLGR